MLERPFKIALLISLGMHSIVLAPWPKIEWQLPKKPQTDIEVTYFKVEDIPELEVREDKKEIVVPKKPVEEVDKEITKKEEPVKKALPVEEMPLPQKEIPQEVAAKKSIQMQSEPDLESDISYMSYSQLVREKIRSYLYRNYRELMGEGDVTVSFVLESSGALKALALIKEPGIFNNNLQALCIKSIEQAAPFKPFPKELNLDEISFKITISFKSSP